MKTTATPESDQTPRPSFLASIVVALSLGVLAVESEILAFAAVVGTVLLALPWFVPFAALVAGSMVQRWTFSLGGVTFRPDEFLVVIFAIRVVELKVRSRWGRTEWVLITFIGWQVVASVVRASDVRRSLLDLGLICFGVLAYLSVVSGIATIGRLRIAARVLLGTVVAAASLGLFALLLYHLAGAVWGVTLVDTLHGFPAIQGLQYEHDVFGSTCAAGALAFIVLWRERSSLFSERMTRVAVWICLLALVLSLARGAWIAFAAGLGIMFVSGPRRSRRLTRLLVAGAIPFVLAGFIVFTFASSPRVQGAGSQTAATIEVQASQALNFSTTTGAHRLAAWREALREVRSSPLLGFGTNSWGQGHFEETRFGPIPAYLGNWFVRTLYDSGIVGLGLLLLFFGRIAWPGPGVRAHRGEAGSLARALVIGSATLLVAYLATDALLLVWPWILFGLARASRRLAATEEQSGAWSKSRSSDISPIAAKAGA